MAKKSPFEEPQQQEQQPIQIDNIKTLFMREIEGLQQARAKILEERDREKRNKDKERFEPMIQSLNDQIAAKKQQMEFALGEQRQKKETFTIIEDLRAREKGGRVQKEAKKQKKREGRGKGKGISLEELRKRLPFASEEQEGEKEEEKQGERAEIKQWEIEAIEGAQEDLEKKKMEREKETEKLVDEAQERDRRERAIREKGSKEAWAPEELEENEEENGSILGELEEGERLKGMRGKEPAPVQKKKESLRSQKERMLKIAVENLARHYEEARGDRKKLERVLEAARVLRSKLEIGDFHDVRDTDDGYEANRLYHEILETVERLQKIVKIKTSPMPSMSKEIPPIEVPEVEPGRAPDVILPSEPRKEEERREEPKPPEELSEETEERQRQQEIARRVEVAYQKFEDARGDTLRLQALRKGVEQSLAKYREAVQQGEPALPEQELRLMQLQRAIEEELTKQEERELAPRSPARPAGGLGEVGEEEPLLPSPENVQNALNVAINNIEAYYNNAGDDETKLENALNAIESVLSDISKAIGEKRWNAQEQKKRLLRLHYMIREKIKNL